MFCCYYWCYWHNYWSFVVTTNVVDVINNNYWCFVGSIDVVVVTNDYVDLKLLINVLNNIMNFTFEIDSKPLFLNLNLINVQLHFTQIIN